MLKLLLTIITLLFASSSFSVNGQQTPFLALRNSNPHFTPRTGSVGVVIPPISRLIGPGHIVIGGLTTTDGNSAQNDIWHSANSGVTWNNIPSNLPVGIANVPALYIPKSRGTWVTYVPGYVAIFGQSSGTGTNGNAVYLSTNSLSTWSTLTFTNSWSPRSDHSAAALISQSRHLIFVMGGYSVDSNQFLNDVWCIWASDDDRSLTSSSPQWVNLGSAPWTTRSGMAVASFHSNTRIIVAGGINGNSASNTIYNDVWILETDATFNAIWEPYFATPTFMSRAYGAMFYMNQHLFVTAGINVNRVETNDVWTSVDDGRTWTVVSSAANFPTRTNPLVFILDNQLLLTGGCQGTTFYNDVWVGSF